MKNLIVLLALLAVTAIAGCGGGGGDGKPAGTREIYFPIHQGAYYRYEAADSSGDVLAYEAFTYSAVEAEQLILNVENDPDFQQTWLYGDNIVHYSDSGVGAFWPEPLDYVRFPLSDGLIWTDTAGGLVYQHMVSEVGTFRDYENVFLVTVVCDSPGYSVIPEAIYIAPNVGIVRFIFMGGWLSHAPFDLVEYHN